MLSVCGLVQTTGYDPCGSAIQIGTALILLTAAPLHKFLGQRGLSAVERLMGMLLVMMSVQMMINAVRGVDWV
jgi:small neutral amino acid transporter SnatA (MarC family)